MPNVDSCVREAEAGLCSNHFEHALHISRLSNNLRVQIFRNKSVEEIDKILQQCSETVRACIIDKFYDDSKEKISIDDIIIASSSNNNRDGADLIHVLPDKKIISIEVKFGAQTDRNIGMQVFEKIFSSHVFTNALSINNRRAWLSKFDRDSNEENQFNRLQNALNEAIDIFNIEQKNKNFKLTQTEQKYMENIIINASGSSDFLNKYDYYLKFVLDGEDFNSFSRIITGVGSWIVQSVNKLSDNIKRVNVFVNNYDTNTQIKYTLNWKNNYKYNGKSLMAKLGFGSPSWNVWITVEITTLE